MKSGAHPSHADFLVWDTITYEQANVNHLNEVLVALYTTEQTYVYGSTSDINTLWGTQTGTPQITVRNSMPITDDRLLLLIRTKMARMKRFSST